jgi:pimeloyl-ACP methyl ester carboxylesterase
MAALTHRITAWDGLVLHAQEWGGGAGLPLLCLPGLVRTADDFAVVADRHGTGRRVVSLDYAGRGRSAYARSVSRYAPRAILRDVLDICAALHLHRCLVIGTSFGGLLAMGIATARPGLMAGLLLNDIGPEIGSAGAAFIRRFVADDPALPDLETAAEHLRRMLPYLSFASTAEWQAFARNTYAPGPDGRWHPRWDRRLADIVPWRRRDLWPLFAALAPVRLALVHGESSALLLPHTVVRMRSLRPDMAVTSIAGVGHAPSLAEPAATAALERFIAAGDGDGR